MPLFLGENIDLIQEKNSEISISQLPSHAISNSSRLPSISSQIQIRPPSYYDIVSSASRVWIDIVGEEAPSRLDFQLLYRLHTIIDLEHNRQILHGISTTRLAIEFYVAIHAVDI